MKYSFITFVFFLLSVKTIAQKPMWANSYHKELVNSYIDVYTGTGNTVDEARSKARQRVALERNEATGAHYTISEQDERTNTSKNDYLEVKSRVIDEYVERIGGGYSVSLLVQVARNPMYSFEPVDVTDQYSAGARIVFPGWAQIYKGQTVKGLVMLAGVVGCGIGALVCENTRSDYKNKMKEQPEFAQTYNTKANNNETARNICIGAAGAFYLWSLIDGIASKGKRRVFVGKTSSLSFSPIAMPDAAGLAFTYNF